MNGYTPLKIDNTVVAPARNIKDKYPLGELKPSKVVRGMLVGPSFILKGKKTTPQPPPADAARASERCRRENVMEWLPIESAPKTGRYVLIFYRNELGKSRTIVAFYAQQGTLENETVCYGDEEECAPEGWYEAVWANEHTAQVEQPPTHWMPLPPPPASTLEG